jgi:Mrp family chromosome partitioning ATPase/DUF971 family protein
MRIRLLHRTLTFSHHPNKLRFSSSSSHQFSNQQQEILQKLRKIPSPLDPSRDIVYSGFIRDIQINKDRISIALELNDAYRTLKSQISNQISQEFGIPVRVYMANESSSSSSNSNSGIKHIVGVSSCKGGVGKSTVAVNLAYALSFACDKRVGIFDADIYGPSLPTMVHPKNLAFKESKMNPGKLLPLEYLGVKLMSYGFLKKDAAAIMRGPMVTNLLVQILKDVDWGDLDYLIVDMPPGTGDIHITLSQALKFSGALIVTTPQKLSYVDVEKGIRMFDAVKVPTLGVVENMSYFRCECCGTKTRPFGKGYLNGLKERFSIEKGFELPLLPDVSEFGDKGEPFFLQDNLDAGKEAREVFVNIAKTLDETCSNSEFRKVSTFVTFDETNHKIVVKSKDSEDIVLDPALVRRNCRCALCVDELTGKQILKPEKIADSIRPVKISPRGNYAVSVVWSDSHASSIYTFDYLTKLSKNQDRQEN